MNSPMPSPDPTRPLPALPRDWGFATRATGNSRSGSQKFPPLSVKIPENSRYENTPTHPVCKRKFIKIVIYLPITN